MGVRVSDRSDQFVAGIIIALQSVILTDIVGIDNLSAAFGISLFVLGFAAFAGPPMAGTYCILFLLS